MKRRSLLCLLLLLSACTLKTKEPNIKRLRIRFAAEIATIDPTQSIDSTSRNVIETLNDGLLRLGLDNQLMPALAESWSVSPDYTLYTFILRPNLKWSDGQVIVAHQFVDAAERALTVANGVQTSSFLLPIENAKEFYSGKLKDFSKVAFRAVDERTLEIKLTHSMPYWINIAAFPLLMPIRKDILAKYGDRWTEATHYVGTGSYRLKEKDLHGRILCEKNPFYWNQEALKGAFKEVELRIVEDGNTAVTLFKRGEFDIVDSVPSMLTPMLEKTEPAFKSLRTLFITGLGLRLDHPAMKNSLLRRALAESIDYESMKQLLRSDSSHIDSWVPPELSKSNNGVALAFNPVEAKKLWRALKNPPKKLEYLFPSGGRSNVMAQFIQQQWKNNLGIEVELVPQEWKVYLKSRINGDFPIFQQNWLADYPAAINFLEIFTCTNEQNNPHMCSHTYDTLLNQSATVKNDEERLKLFAEAEKILLQKEIAVIPLTRENINYLINPRLSGFALDSTSQFRIADIRLLDK